jgi:hypothetical protein
MFGFGAGNQDIRGDAKIPAVELLASGDVLGRFALETFVKIAAIVDPCDFGELFFWMGIKIYAFTIKCVGEQDFRSKPGGASRSFLEQLRALKQSCLDRHQTGPS